VAGWYVNDSGALEPCPLSTFKDVIGNSTCSSCPAGMVTITLGATDAAACIPAAGFYADNGRILPCPSGTFKATEGLGLCTACPANSNTIVTGATSLFSCLAAAGFFNAASGAVTPCPFGTYKEAIANTSSCTACGTGTSTAATASTSVTACQAAAGFFTPVEGGLVRACPFGTFAEGLGFRRSCVSCAANMNTTAMASTRASACLATPGYYTPTPGGPAVPCPFNTFKEDLENSTTCTDCSGPTITLTLGTTDRKQW
jgi:hypothetical protein